MTSGIEALLSTYPRTRKPLPDSHKAIYEAQYRINRDGAQPVEALAQRLERWMHRRVASQRGGPVLELGAGTLNHVKFESESAPYDIVEPFRALFEGRPERSRIRNVFSDISEIPPGDRYKRCISIAVLEHLTNLPSDVAVSALHLEDDGIFQAGIPSEGGWLWWLGWRGATGVSYRLRTGLDYGYVMRHEHVNTANEIVAVVRHFFREVRLSRFPAPGHHASFYTYIEARAPDVVKARNFASRRTGVAQA